MTATKPRTAIYVLTIAVIVIFLFSAACGCVKTATPETTPAPSLSDSSNPRPSSIDGVNRSNFDQVVLQENPDFTNVVDVQHGNGEISPYQRYISPDAPAVQALAANMDNARQAYAEGVSWVWVSDMMLNGEIEFWLKPQQFLNGTPTYETNPVQGSPASDCEEQANALTSLLRAIDIPPENVRSVMGKVNFSGEVGGHVWTEVWHEGRWVQLDCTSGPYWDEGAGKFVDSIGLPFGHFVNNEYPVVEVWYYFNDRYFLDVMENEGNAPETWKV